jgi:hypothetical protein
VSTVAELMTWALQGPALKSYLGVSGSAEDTTLALYLGAWAEAADLYLDGADFDTLPPTVQLAVFGAVQITRDQYGRGDLRSVQTKDLRETFAFAFSTDASLASMRALLRPWKENRELDGGGSWRST